MGYSGEFIHTLTIRTPCPKSAYMKSGYNMVDTSGGEFLLVPCVREQVKEICSSVSGVGRLSR